ncbi:MAG TPA: helix-turn-helix domain-containing protein, partial [Rhodospirillales bacterium]|nr:helix-turn-helix domain-containing protein [Rhodospirillales bacterium]
MNSVIHPSLNSDIGALLRAARLRRGDNLRQVSNVLKIRYNYLESIENGRFDDLPGATYSTGFIRTYSEYLGLDGEELVSKLKAESNVLTDNTKLAFPAIIPEDGIPGSLVVLLGLLITVLGYSTWYWFSSPDVFVAENLTTIPKVATVKVEATSTKPPVAAENPSIEASSAVAATAKFPSQNHQNVERRTEANAPAQA